MITSIIRYHTAIHYIMSITRDRFRPNWVSSGGCKKHSIINMLKKQICHWVQKKCNAKQYGTAIPISWGPHSRTHTHDMDNKSHRQALIGVQDHCQDQGWAKCGLRAACGPREHFVRPANTFETSVNLS